MAACFSLICAVHGSRDFCFFSIWSVKPCVLATVSYDRLGGETFKSVADGVEFFLFDGETGFQFCEFCSMFLDFFGMVRDPARGFRKRMFTLQ